MSWAVWKYPLELTDCQSVRLRRGSEPLYAVVQHGRPVLYVLSDAAIAREERRTVWMHGTGHPVQASAAAQSMGCLMLADGDLMFHVFIEPASKP